MISDKTAKWLPKPDTGVLGKAGTVHEANSGFHYSEVLLYYHVL